MARLAEYMREIATLLGEVQDVHFSHVQKGSLRLVAQVAPGRASGRVQARTDAIRRQKAPAEAMRAYIRINQMVAEDGGPARMTFGGGVVLRFPGHVPEKASIVTLVDSATITGRLYALIEDQSGQLKARIRPRNGSGHIACTAEGHVGKQLRNYFLEAVRVRGRGVWARSTDGEWICQSLHIEEVYPVKDASLRDAINALRSIESDWSEDPLADWDFLDEKGGAA